MDDHETEHECSPSPGDGSWTGEPLPPRVGWSIECGFSSARRLQRALDALGREPRPAPHLAGSRVRPTTIQVKKVAEVQEWAREGHLSIER